jgi:hypothetical protein
VSPSKGAKAALGLTFKEIFELEIVMHLQILKAFSKL